MKFAQNVYFQADDACSKSKRDRCRGRTNHIFFRERRSGR